MMKIITFSKNLWGSHFRKFRKVQIGPYPGKFRKMKKKKNSEFPGTFSLWKLAIFRFPKNWKSSRPQTGCLPGVSRAKRVPSEGPFWPKTGQTSDIFQENLKTAYAKPKGLRTVKAGGLCAPGLDRDACRFGPLLPIFRVFKTWKMAKNGFDGSIQDLVKNPKDFWPFWPKKPGQTLEISRFWKISKFRGKFNQPFSVPKNASRFVNHMKGKSRRRRLLPKFLVFNHELNTWKTILVDRKSTSLTFR